jgi:RHS repeat-associated protein
VRSNKSGTSALSWLAADQHGTCSVAMDATTQAVTKRYTTPFGASRTGGTGTWPDDKGFLGKSADSSSGLTHLDAREYDPVIGRFISVDPVLETTDGQTLNGYTYAGANPATFSDPTGRTRCDVDPSFCGKPSPAPVVACPSVTNPQCPESKGGTASGGDTTTPSPSPGPSPTNSGPCNCGSKSPYVNIVTELGWNPFYWQNNLNGANALAVTYYYSFTRGGCTRGQSQVICYGGSPGGKHPMTVGDVLFYPKSKKGFEDDLDTERRARKAIELAAGRKTAEKYGPNVLKHEAVHSKQWSKYSSATDFITDYGMEAAKSKWKTGEPWAVNSFETEANLWWGGYLAWQPLQWGPVP